MYCLRLRRLVLIFVNPLSPAAGANFTSARSERNRVCAFFAVFITPGLQCPPMPSQVSVVKMQILKILNNHML
ncbi:hypothetical protein A6J50_13800 [Neisseria meningitidis]|nr:hypothetical protein A6J54_13570 [Neisseria meningitidis]AVH83275.1 hypothetical protein A6J50_13800 [Neisseria meningitidis]